MRGHAHLGRLWLTHCGENGSRPFPYAIVLRKGQLQELVGDWDGAETCFRQNLAAAEQQGDPRDVGDSKYHLGILTYLKGDYDAALALLSQALEISQRLGDSAGISRTLPRIGNIHLDQGRFDQALEHYNGGLELSRQLGDTEGVIGVLNNIGILHGMRQEFDLARRCFQEVAETARQTGSSYMLAKACGNLGIVSMSQSDYAAAQDFFRRDLEITQSMGDKQGLAGCLSNLAMLSQDQGKYGEALDRYREILATSIQMGNLYFEATGHHGIGAVCKHFGRYPEAVAEFGLAETIFRKLNDGYDRCTVIRDRIGLYLDTDRESLAAPEIEEARRLAQANGRNDMLDDLTVCESLALKRTDPKAAAADLRKLLEQLKAPDHQAWIRLEIYKLTGDEECRQTALRLYAELYDKTPRHQYQEMIDKLNARPHSPGSP